MIAATSREAYELLQPRLGRKQQIVFEAIKKLGSATNEQLADFLGWPINNVTGRCTELRKFGVIGVEGLGRNKSGRSAKLWSVRDPNDKSLEAIANDCEG